MHHLLAEFGEVVVAGLRRAEGPRARLTAMIEGSFGPEQFHPPPSAPGWPSTPGAQSPGRGALLRIYQRRPHRPSACAAPAGARAGGRAHRRPAGAVIDGVYLREALRGRPTAPAAAIAAIEDYLELDSGGRADAGAADRLALDRRTRGGGRRGRAFDVLYPATGEVIARLHAATPGLDRARRWRAPARAPAGLGRHAARRARAGAAARRRADPRATTARCRCSSRSTPASRSRRRSSPTGLGRRCLEYFAGRWRRARGRGHRPRASLRLHPPRAARRVRRRSAPGTIRSRSPAGRRRRRSPPATR